MKKLYLSITLFFMFILMFSVTMIPTQASSYQGITLDTPIGQLFSYSLKEVFEDFNVVPNSRFDNDDILLYDSFNTNIFSIEDGVLYGQGDNITTRAFVMLDVLTIGETYYLRYDIETSIIGNSNTRLYSGSLSTPFISGVTSYNSYSVKGVADTYRLFVADWRYDTLNQDDEILKVDNVFAIQLDSDLATLNISILDYYYNLYTALYYNLNIDLFYNDGENDGYDDGYNDGLVEGYFDGNSAYHQGIYEYDYLTGVPYLEGLETGFNNGVDYAVQENISILSIFELIFGVALNMFTFIITIDIFGISILSLISVLSLFVGVVWILKMIRG